MPAPEKQIQQPDPVKRRKAFTILLFVLVVGLLTILASDRLVGHLRELARDDPDAALAQARTLLMALAAVLAFGLGALALWLLRFSLRIHEAERFPPPGSAVIRPTTVLTGEAARRRALMSMILAALLAGGGIGAAVAVWRLAEALAGF